jgi:hypothetical protein
VVKGRLSAASDRMAANIRELGFLIGLLVTVPVGHYLAAVGDGPIPAWPEWLWAVYAGLWTLVVLGVVVAALIPTPEPPLFRPDPASSWPEQRSLTCADMPDEPPGFRPRTELLERIAAGGPVVVLTGASGAGKTQIAAAYARSLLRDGTTSVVWINASSADELRSGVDRLADALGVRYRGEESPRHAERCRRLMTQVERPVLLVFDDAADIAPLGPWLDLGDHVQVLITSRDVHVPDAIEVTALTPTPSSMASHGDARLLRTLALLSPVGVRRDLLQGDGRRVEALISDGTLVSLGGGTAVTLPPGIRQSLLDQIERDGGIRRRPP